MTWTAALAGAEDEEPVAARRPAGRRRRSMPSRQQ